MKKVASLALAALVAVLCVLMPPEAAAAPTFELTVDKKVVRGGGPITVAGRVSVDCDWVVRFAGDLRHETGRTFTTNYRAPVVTRPTKLKVEGACFYAPATPPPVGAAPNPTSPQAAGQRLHVQVPPRWRRTIVITVLPKGAVVSPPGSGGDEPGDGGTLPNTGGPDGWLLLLALGSVGLGVVLVRGSTSAARPARSR